MSFNPKPISWNKVHAQEDARENQHINENKNINEGAKLFKI